LRKSRVLLRRGFLSGSLAIGSESSAPPVDTRRREDHLPASLVSTPFAARFSTFGRKSRPRLCRHESSNNSPPKGPVPLTASPFPPKTLRLSISRPRARVSASRGDTLHLSAQPARDRTGAGKHLFNRTRRYAASTPQVRRPGGHRTPSTTLYKPDAAPFRQRRNVRTVPGDDSPKCLPRARNLRLPGGSGTPREDRGAEQAGSLAMTRRPSCRRDNSRRFPTHVPLGGRKRSAALPWRGQNAFTDCVPRDAPPCEGPAPHARAAATDSDAAVLRARLAPPTRHKDKEDKPLRHRHGSQPDAPLLFFVPGNIRHRATARWSGTRGRLLLMGCC
jgi:hypothetical protein